MAIRSLGPERLIGQLQTAPEGSVWPAECRRCRRIVSAPVEAIMARYRFMTPLHVAETALRCSGCQHLGGRVYLVERPSP